MKLRFSSIFALAAGLLLSGCTRKNYFSFINTSSEDCTVSVTGPDGITHELGTVEKDFGQQNLGVLVRRQKCFEPIPGVCLTWQCGDNQSTIMVDDDTPRDLWIGLPDGELLNPRKTIDSHQTYPAIYSDQKLRSRAEDPEDRTWLKY